MGKNSIIKTLTSRDVAQITGFFSLVLLIIMFMVFVKTKHDTQVEKLDFIKGLFGWGKDPPPNSTVPSSVHRSSPRSTVRSTANGSTASGSTASGSTAR
jgi:hypothetical protein